MARKKIWEDEPVSEYEQLETASSPQDEEFDVDAFVDDLDEEVETPQRNVKPKLSKNPAYTLNSKETDIMQLAMVQLEQAKLYDMFLKHNLFEGVKANPVALKKVERELKEFILERMQILLGMKEEKSKDTTQGFVVKLPFNEVEIDCLKDLAFKVTKGESAKSKAKSVEATPSFQREERIKPIVENRMKPMFQEVEEDEEEEEYEEPVQRQVKPVQRQARPIAKKQPDRSRMTTEQLAIEDLKRMAKRKPAHLMNEDELLEANKNIRTNKPVAAGAIPMPTADGMIGHYMNQQSQREAILGGGGNLNAILMNKLGATNTVHNDGED